VKDRSDASISKAKKLKSTKSTTISLSRTKKKGYERVFWVSTYYVYNGKTYINPSKTPITFGGTQYIYRNTKSKITQIKEEVYGAVDGQISIMRYYTAAGKLNKYQKYAYDKYGFITKIKTYNAAGKLIKTEKWR
jgi:UDP-glucose 4-epimerase